MRALCRDCGARGGGRERCSVCGSPRTIAHRELQSLSIAHIDCDAFYAAVEKRDRPELLDRPVIVGGGRRGVVSTACYIARLYGVRSAMPMFKALAACPDAVVLAPDMARYRAVGAEVRALMQKTCDRVQPVSIDEAYLDFSDADARGTAAERLVALARDVERSLGISVSIGLSHNKLLAKLASDLDKPRGFSVVGRAETREFLAPLPVRKLQGVGPALARRLGRDGINTVEQLQRLPAADLERRYGRVGVSSRATRPAWTTARSRRAATRKAFPPRPRSRPTPPTQRHWKRSWNGSRRASPSVWNATVSPDAPSSSS